MTTKEKLAKLNELHTILGRGTFKAWKQSVAKLDIAIAKAQQEVDLRNTELTKEEVTPADTELGLMINRYNELRKVMGYKVIDGWRGTRDQLASAMTKLKADHLELIRSEETAKKPKPTGKPRIVSVPAMPTKKTKAPTKTSDSFLPGLAAELGMNPKVARTKLRKMFGSDWRTMPVKDVRAALTKKGA